MNQKLPHQKDTASQYSNEEEREKEMMGLKTDQFHSRHHKQLTKMTTRWINAPVNGQ